jgi:hypothetical protein
MKMKRYQECLKELQDVLYKLDKTNVKALYRKVQVYEILGSTKEANEAIKFYEGIPNRTDKDDKIFNALKVKIQKRILEDEIKTREFSRNMMNN